MSLRPTILWCVISLTTALAGLWGCSRNPPPDSVAPTGGVAASAQPTTAVKPQSAADKARLGAALKAFFEAAEKSGFAKMIPPPKQFLSEAVATGDKGQILRAFHDAIYARYWPCRTVVPVLVEFLHDPNPFVQFHAARDLFIVGDRSGYSTLLNFVKSGTAIDGLGKDLRISAAQILAQYGETEATSAIVDLYIATDIGMLSPVLADLGVPLPGGDGLRYVQSTLALTEYGQANEDRFVPQITATFQATRKPELKAAAAWALATLTGDEQAISYLIQAANVAISGQSRDIASRAVVKALGSIQDPRVKPVLESALTSSDPYVVQVAIVNLIYNQGDSVQASQFIASQLNDETHAKLPWEFTLNVAAQLLDHENVRNAGQHFAKTDPTQFWQLYTVDRKDWPVENWIGDYVVTRKKKPR